MDKVKDALVKLGWSHYDSDLWWKDGVIKSIYDAIVEELENLADFRFEK